MAQVKYTGMVALTDSSSGQTYFFPVEGRDVASSLIDQILSDPASVTNVHLRFKLDENNNTVRAYIEVS